MRTNLAGRQGRFVFSRLHTATDLHHAEQLLATARLALCAAGAVAVAGFDDTPRAFSRIVEYLVLLYALHGLGVSIALRLVRVRSARPGIILHALDIAWAVALALLAGPPPSPFFVLLLFVLLSAAFRWRLRQTIITGAIVLAAISVQPLMDDRLSVGMELMLIRATYIVVATVLLGLLAEDEKGRRAQAGITGELLAGIQAQAGFRAALRLLATALMRLTRSDGMLIVARELDTDRAVLWTARPQARGGAMLSTQELTDGTQNVYFFRAAGDAWAVTRRHDNTCVLRAIDPEEDEIRRADCNISEAFWRLHDVRSLLAVNLGFGGQWRARVFLMRRRRYRLRELRFAHRMLCQLAPAMHNQYLLRRLRSRAVAGERRRVARELHDGVIQSLTGLELETAALRRRLAARDPEVDAQLQRIQQVLGEEARNVRDVMHLIRPLEAGPGQFIAALREIVDRFERDTGVQARFHAAPSDVYVPPRAARELARTLQEALTNVRRHSGARQVDVEFRCEAAAWRLDIENNGRPFNFTGRLTLDELEERRLGPRVIKERVREMGGDLVIESSAASGVRLEISLPRPEGQYKSA
jgi:signal transduction histidine kinase